jgi:hypothetical protein
MMKYAGMLHLGKLFIRPSLPFLRKKICIRADAAM